MRRWFVLAGVIALGAAALIGCGGKGKGEDVARVNGKPITRDEVLKESGSVLDDLITRMLVRQRAQERGIKVTDEEVNRRINISSDWILADTGESMEQWLKERGQTMADLKDKVAFQVLLYSKFILPEADRKQFFEENKQWFVDRYPQNNEAVIYRQIIVASKEEAEKLRNDMIAKKQDFTTVAKEKSLDAVRREKGGMVGWMVKGKVMPDEQELEKALFALKPGEISQPLKYTSPFAQQPQPGATAPPEQWQLVTVVKHIPAHPVRMEDNEDQLENVMMNLQNAPYQMQMQQFLNDLKAKAKIEILNPDFKLLEVKYQQLREDAERMKQMSGGMGAGMPQLPQSAPEQGGAAKQAPATGK